MENRINVNLIITKIRKHFSLIDFEDERVDCVGCKHLCYDSGGSADCSKGVYHICPKSGFRFREEESVD